MAQLSPALPPLQPQSHRKPKNLLALCVAIVIFAAMSLWMAIVSKGFLEMDACVHYMFARHSLAEPAYLINIWGRPLCTAIYALPAAIGGVIGVRVMSLLLAIISGIVAYRIAQKQNYRLPALAAILLFAQPLFYLHSFSELTEIPFAFVAILAFWAYQSKNFLTMAILVSITPSGRPEGLFLVALAAVALLAHRRWYYLFILPLPILIWSYFGWRSYGSPNEYPWYMWLKENWPYAMKSAYGDGPWYWFIILLPVLLSPIIFPTIFPGVILSLREGFARTPKSRESNGLIDADPDSQSHTLQYATPVIYHRLAALYSDHIARCQFIILFIPLVIFIVHSYLRANGLMGSNGELRYLLSVAPFWALLCAKGWEWIWTRLRLPAPFLFAALASTAPIVANCYWRVVPLRVYQSDILAQQVADWYKKTPSLEADYPRFLSSHPVTYFTLDVSQSDPKHGETWTRENVLKKRADGVLLLWDKNALHNASRDMIVTQEEVGAAGWIWIGNFVYGGEWCNIYLSPKTIKGAPTDPNQYHTPLRHEFDE